MAAATATTTTMTTAAGGGGGDGEAFASMLTDDGFLPGVQALVQSLRTTSPPSRVHTFVVLVTPTVGRVVRAKLKRLGVTVLPVGAVDAVTHVVLSFV